MNVAMVLAGLTPRAKQIDGMGFGGSPAWEFADRVALLAGLKGPALDWAYYRYCGHEARLLPVLRHVMACIDVFCGMNRLRLRRETRAGLVQVALLDMTSPVCHECGGSGSREIVVTDLLTRTRELRKEACHVCHGSGRQRMSRRAIAESCGIAHASMGRTHDLVMWEAGRLLAGLDGQVWRCAADNNRADCHDACVC